jgi:hypothetical protein
LASSIGFFDRFVAKQFGIVLDLPGFAFLTRAGVRGEQ